MTGLKRIALLAAILAWLVIGLGAFTRLSDAGLGCPDWPGCYGHLGVLSQLATSPAKAWIEMIHRYFAGTLALLVIVTAFLCVRHAAKHGFIYLLLGLLLFILVIYQALLGMWTVTLKLMPVIVTQHLLGGMTLLGLLSIIYLKSCGNSLLQSGQKSGRIAGILALILVFLQIALGAWTSTHYAALACTDFPFCGTHGVIPQPGSQITELSEAARQIIHMMHRFGALFLTLYLLLFVSIVLRSARGCAAMRCRVYLLCAVLLLQLSLGIANVVLQLPLPVAVLHNMVAALLLCVVININYHLGNFR